MKRKFLYRVDNDLLTVTAVPIENFEEIPPVNQWFYAMFGPGSYCYKESEQEAKELMIEIIDAKIDELTVRKFKLQ